MVLSSTHSGVAYYTTIVLHYMIVLSDGRTIQPCWNPVKGQI